MKSRDSLVSNSSSTSFIVAAKKPTKCTHCGCTHINLKDLINRVTKYDCSEDTEMEASGVEQIIERMKTKDGWWVYDEASTKRRDDLIAEIEKMIELEKGDWDIIWFKSSYHDDMTNEVIKDMKENGTLRIIWKGE